METSFSTQSGQEEISLYNSALENLTFSSSFGENGSANTSTDLDVTLSKDKKMNLKESTVNFLQSESSDNLEVDPKSQLANKTIFKTDNPHLSIIEINNTSKEEDEEGAVYLIESDDDEPRKKYDAIKHSKLKSDPSEASLSSDTDITVDKSLGCSSSTDGSESKNSSSRIIKTYETLEEFEKNLPPTVTVLTTPFGSKVYLVGTAHFSEESQDDVSFVIRNVRPDIVMVELCPSRIHILKHDEKTLLEEAKNFNLAKIRNIINTNGFINGIFFILLLHMSAHLAKELGMAPGGEFRRAFEEVHRLPGCMLQLGDRPINITLQRALRALSLWQTMKLVWRLTSTQSISLKQVEECKQRDLLEKLLKEMAGEYPAFSDVFVKERDLYLCHSLQVAALPHTTPNGLPKPVKVVGVVGIGHADGIAKNWGKVDPSKIPDILEIPPANTSTRIVKYTVKYGILGLTVFVAYKFIRPKLHRLF